MSITQVLAKKVMVKSIQWNATPWLKRKRQPSMNWYGRLSKIHGYGLLKARAVQMPLWEREEEEREGERLWGLMPAPWQQDLCFAAVAQYLQQSLAHGRCSINNCWWVNKATSMCLFIYEQKSLRKDTLVLMNDTCCLWEDQVGWRTGIRLRET